MTQDNFLERLQIALKDESIHAFARRSGISDSTLRQYERGSMPGLAKLIEISEATGTTIDWLATGKEPMRSTSALQAPIGEVQGFTLVPRLDIQASAGNGSLSYSEEPIDLLAFQESWLRDRNINPRFARVLTAKGDSMEPTIRDGDVLLVDTSITSVHDNAIYIVVYNGHTLVKRVNMIRNGSLTIISDNDRHPPEDVPLDEVPDLHIAGRVMWFGRSI